MVNKGGLPFKSSISHLPPIGSTQSIVFMGADSIKTPIICGD